MDDYKFAYVGFCKCGSLVAAVVDDPSHRKQTAEDVGEFIIAGYRVERRSVEEVRITLQFCECPKPKQLAPVQP